MCVAQVMIMLDMTIVNVALPSIQSELDVPPSNLEWIINAYTLALASLILVGGALGDRYGRRRIFLAGLVVFTLGSLGCALSPDDPELIALRGLQGVGAAAMSPLTLSILVAAFPGPRAPGAIGLWAAVGSLGFGAGPVIGGLLVDTFDWSAVFWVNVPLGVLCGAVTLLAVKESHDPKARRLDPLGAGLAASALLVVTLALIGTATHAWLSPRTLATLAVAAVLAAAFIWWEARSPEPMVPLDLFHDRRLVMVVVATVCAYASLGVVLYLLTLFFQNVRGYSPFEAGLSIIPISVSFMVLAPFAGRAGKRWGTPRVTAAGCIAAAVSVAAIALTGPDTPYAVFVVPYLLFGAGLRRDHAQPGNDGDGRRRAGALGPGRGDRQRRPPDGRGARRRRDRLGGRHGRRAVVEQPGRRLGGRPRSDRRRRAGRRDHGEARRPSGRDRRRRVHDRHARRNGARRAGAGHRRCGDPCRISANASSARSRAAR